MNRTLITTAITELLQDIALLLALDIVLGIVGFKPNIWQWIIIVLFVVLVSAIHYRRGLRYGLSFVVTSFVKENIDK